MADGRLLSAERKALLEQRLRAVGGQAAAPRVIPPRPANDAVPLSTSQSQTWVINAMTPGNPAYNLPLAWWLRGPLNLSFLKRSFDAIVARHEVLRTTFDFHDGKPVQVVHPALAVELQVRTLEQLDPGLRMEALHDLASAAARAPFDLARLPLIRVNLYRTAETEHVLLVNIHHIVADGLSFALLLRELDAYYRYFARSDELRLPALEVQYADFAAWQRRRSEAPDSHASQLAFWTAQLGGPLPVLALPCDMPRPTEQSFSGANIFLTLPAPLVGALRELGVRESCTFFMVILAVFEVLLNRFSGADDIIIGTPVASRTPREVEPLIGSFINMVPLRCNLAGHPTFIDVLRRSRDTALDAVSNGDVPVDALLRQLKVARDASRSAIFQAILQMLPPMPVRIGDIECRSFWFDPATAQFDLALHLYEEADGCTARFEYCTNLFEADTAKRMAAAFHQLLRAVVSDPGHRIEAILLLTEPERRRLCDEWNRTAGDYPRAALMQTLFELQALRVPGRQAVGCGSTVLTYGELEARANGIAQALRARGVGRGQRVGLCVERGVDMVAGLLGVLKSGAAYVPLDPAFPQERLRFMVEDAQLAQLVSTAALAEPFGLARERQLLLDADAGLLEAQPAGRCAADAAKDAGPEDAAYVIYTSGSTGRPKGVVVPHRAVVNFLASMAREPGLGEEDVLVAVTTLSFDIAVLELLLPLTVGARVAIATRDELIDGQALGALLERHGATVMQATPVTWRLLLEAGWRGRRGFKALVGGEALPKDVAEGLLGCGVELWNMYGPTETTVWSTCARIEATSGGITIGRPIANTTVYVLDAQGQLCPIGVAGELCIGGEGVTLGYWKRPELTAERFVADRYSAAPGATLYRTGDRARWRNDGTLEHLGRLDDQVKVRGYRIELAEIEAVLAEHPGVRQAAVHLWQVKANDVRIVACCVPTGGGVLAPISLRKHLRARLPEYMVPQEFLAVAELPLTPNGKVDRRRLPVPVATASQLGQHEAPAEGAEATIAEIWTKLIQPARPIGRSDRFFEVGGYSLLGIQALRQIEASLGAALHFRVLVHETLAEIAAHCPPRTAPAPGERETGAGTPPPAQEPRR